MFRRQHQSKMQHFRMPLCFDMSPMKEKRKHCMTAWIGPRLLPLQTADWRMFSRGFCLILADSTREVKKNGLITWFISSRLPLICYLLASLWSSLIQKSSKCLFTMGISYGIICSYSQLDLKSRILNGSRVSYNIRSQSPLCYWSMRHNILKAGKIEMITTFPNIDEQSQSDNQWDHRWSLFWSNLMSTD